MTNLLRSEILKLRTVRSTWLIFAAAVLTSAILGVAIVRLGTSGTERATAAQAALLPAQVMWFFGTVLAVIAGAGEFAHHSIRTTVLFSPGRTQVLAAKATVAAAAGALLTVVGGVSSVVAASIVSGMSDVSMPFGDATGWSAIAVATGIGAAWSVLATGLGVLTRNTAIAVAGLLIWRFVGEGLLPSLTMQPDRILRWLPFGASDATLGAPGLLPAGAAAALLAGYVAVVYLGARIALARRDL